MTRREEREFVFAMLFGRSFNTEVTAEEYYMGELENRDVSESKYIKKVFFGVEEHQSDIDAMAEKYFQNWKRSRISAVSSAVIRLSVYEMMYMDIPHKISINEAIELSKKFDEPKAKGFVNGVLNAVSKELEGTDGN